MNRKVVALILILAALGLLVWWGASGGQIWTMEQVEVEKTDELFGTVSKEWKDEYRPGLLPIIGPAAGALLLIGGALLLRARTRRPVV